MRCITHYYVGALSKSHIANYSHWFVSMKLEHVTATRFLASGNYRRNNPPVTPARHSARISRGAMRSLGYYFLRITCHRLSRPLIAINTRARSGPLVRGRSGVRLLNSTCFPCARQCHCQCVLSGNSGRADNRPAMH